jgi:hypothetical protein
MATVPPLQEDGHGRGAQTEKIQTRRSNHMKPPAEQETEQGMTGEEWLARLYCEPKSFWRCTHQLDGSSYYTFDEINYPKNWLKVVAKYTQEEPSEACLQLHRNVEASRKEFREKQNKIYGERSLYSIARNRKSIYEREDSAWDTFGTQKKRHLATYLKAVKTGVLERRKRGKNAVSARSSR